MGWEPYGLCKIYWLTRFVTRFLTVALIIAISVSELHGFDMTCKFSVGGGFSGWSYAANGNRCEATGLRVNNEGDTITSINGKTADFYADQHVKSFYADYQSMKFFPKGLATFFPELEEINVWSSDLETIKKSDLAPFKHLKALKLSANKIKEIDSDLLQENKELVGVSFYWNRLEFIGGGIIDNLEKLEGAWFMSNECIDSYSSPGQTTLSELIAEIKEKCAKPAAWWPEIINCMKHFK